MFFFPYSKMIYHFLEYGDMEKTEEKLFIMCLHRISKQLQKQTAIMPAQILSQHAEFLKNDVMNTITMVNHFLNL